MSAKYEPAGGLQHYQLMCMQNLFAVNLALFRQQLMSLPRNQDHLRLLRHGFKLYSKSEEDGMIQEIFNRIGIKTASFAEIGSENGLECNTAKLLIEGWGGLWIEANEKHVADATKHFKPFENLEIIHEFVTAENVQNLIPDGLDLLSIDIDGNDYWIWEALEVRPRVVIIEYNPAYAPPMSIVTPYHPTAKWDGTNYSGASLEALTKLAKRKEYRLVGCDISGSNAFFVAYEAIGKARFLEPAVAAELYEPARYIFSLGGQNPPNPKPFVRIE